MDICRLTIFASDYKGILNCSPARLLERGCRSLARHRKNWENVVQAGGPKTPIQQAGRAGNLEAETTSQITTRRSVYCATHGNPEALHAYRS